MATYAQLLNARDTMIELTVTKLPGRLTLKVARSAETMFGALDLIEATRQTLIRSHTQHDDKGEQMFVLNAEGEPELDENDKKQPIWLDEDGGDKFRAELADAVEEDAAVIFIPILLKHFGTSVMFTPQEALALQVAGILKE